MSWAHEEKYYEWFESREQELLNDFINADEQRISDFEAYLEDAYEKYVCGEEDAIFERERERRWFDTKNS